MTSESAHPPPSAVQGWKKGGSTFNEEISTGFVIKGITGVGVLIFVVGIVDDEFPIDALAHDFVFVTGVNFHILFEPPDLGVGSGHLALQEPAVLPKGDLIPQRLHDFYGQLYGSKKKME